MQLINFNKKYLRVIGTLIFLFIAWKVGDVSNLFNILISAKPAPLLATAILSFVILLIKVLRWNFLLSKMGYRYELNKAFIAVASSTFLGVVTPGRIGDFLRVQFIKKDLGVPYTRGLSVSIMDRLCDLYVLIMFTVFAINYLGINYDKMSLIFILNFSIIFLLFAPILFFVSSFFDNIIKKLVSQLIFEKWLEIQNRFQGSMRILLKPAIIMAIPATTLVYIMGFVQGWLIAQSLNIQISFFEIISLLSVTSLLGLLPISISGFGVREFVFSIYFPTIGYTIEQGIIFGLLVSLFLYFLYALIGFITWQLFPLETGKTSG